MNQEDIIRMAREADLVSWVQSSVHNSGHWWIEGHEPGEELERFAELVAAAERVRIIVLNAPVIGHINAHFKKLEST